MCYEIDPQHFFKYRLKELWVNRFGDKGTEMKLKFCEEQKIHPNTLSNDFTARWGSPHHIPADRLAAYALFLGIDAMQLKTRTTLVAA